MERKFVSTGVQEKAELTYWMVERPREYFLPLRAEQHDFGSTIVDDLSLSFLGLV
jgi:hypothetical protein